MAYKFPSEEWTAAFKDAVNANAAYREAGREWTHGAVAMIIDADVELGIDEPTGMVLDVHEGQCRGTSYVKGLEAEPVQAAPFVIVAPYARWKEVVSGDVDPIKAMMQGKLKLKKGHLPTILRFVESNRQLVKSAEAVPTEFL